MTVKELYELFQKFVTNEFAHLRDRVEWLYRIIIATLIGVFLNLLIQIVIWLMKK